MAIPTWITEARSVSEPLIAAATVCVGFLAYRIGRQQAITSGQNLRLALFDRRVSIYKAFIGAMIEASNNNVDQVLDEGMSKLLSKLDEARFLFDGEIFEYLVEIRKTIISCRHQGLIMKQSAASNPSTHQEYVEAYYKSQLWLLENVERLAERVKPWLQIDDSLSFSSIKIPEGDLLRP